MTYQDLNRFGTQKEETARPPGPAQDKKRGQGHYGRTITGLDQDRSGPHQEKTATKNTTD